MLQTSKLHLNTPFIHSAPFTLPSDRHAISACSVENTQKHPREKIEYKSQILTAAMANTTFTQKYRQLSWYSC